MDISTIGRMILGNGMAGSAADDLKLHPIWQQEMMQAQESGQQVVPFDQWKKMRMLQQNNTVANLVQAN